MGICKALTALTAILIITQQTSHGFLLSREQRSSTTVVASASRSSQNDNTESSNTELSRRDLCRSVIGTTAVIISSNLMVGVDSVSAKTDDDDLGYIPAIRPTAYRVDSTQPPTLIPLKSARKELKVLGDLGQGYGTDKEEIKQDTINLNNSMNKLVFGSMNLVSELINPTVDESKVGPGYASFICMGVPATTTTKDIDLASSLLTSIIDARGNKKATALGLAFCPMSVQPALDSYAKTGNEVELQSAMKQSAVTDETLELYMPLIRYAKKKSLQF